MNRGVIRGSKYIKYIDSNKAILWKDRELSIPLDVYEWIDNGGVTMLHFLDAKKKKGWVFDWITVKGFAYKKTVGQEKQYYFPIGLAREISLEPDPVKPQVYYD